MKTRRNFLFLGVPGLVVTSAVGGLALAMGTAPKPSLMQTNDPQNADETTWGSCKLGAHPIDDLKRALVCRMKSPPPEIGPELLGLMTVWFILHEQQGCEEFGTGKDWKYNFLRWALMGRLHKFLAFVSTSEESHAARIYCFLRLQSTKEISGWIGAIHRGMYGWIRTEYYEQSNIRGSLDN